LGTISLASLTRAPIVQITPVPPPSCQDVTSGTSHGKAVIVELMCTDFADRAPSVAKAGHARASGATAKLPITCNYSGVAVGAGCDVTATMTITEILRAHKLVGVTSAKPKRPRRTRKVVIVGRASVVVGAGTTQVIDIPLTGRGAHLLSARGKLPVAIVVTQTVSAANQVVSRQRLTLKAPKSKNFSTSHATAATAAMS
jgi:hypothetical protein